MKGMKIKNIILLLSIIFQIIATNIAYTQSCYTMMFYNVENYFDTFDDKHSNDNEFLPSSPKKWDDKKFNKKTLNLYKVIASIDTNPPVIIGLAEVENRYVIEKLFYSTPLQKFPYKIIHNNSPDKRGIDVALVYRSDISTNIEYEYIRINFPAYPRSTTRDILLAKQIISKDTIFIFVCHFPSRIGGYESEYKRNYTAKILASKIDLLLKSNPFTKIIIMGDFNDEPTDKSINEILKANCSKNIHSQLLINTMCLKNHKTGTIKYKGDWYIFDQIIISYNLFKKGLNNKKFFETSIYNPDFLITIDSKYGGVKPYSTYSDKKYQGGYSDHLPVVIKFCD